MTITRKYLLNFEKTWRILQFSWNHPFFFHMARYLSARLLFHLYTPLTVNKLHFVEHFQGSYEHYVVVAYFEGYNKLFGVLNFLYLALKN